MCLKQNSKKRISEKIALSENTASLHSQNLVRKRDNES